MITNSVELVRLRAEWDGVCKMQRHKTMLVASALAFGAIRSTALADAVANLPLLLAFDVLRQVLKQLKRQGLVKSKRHSLGDLMDDAQTAVPWLDWRTLRDGVRRRNAVAHDGAIHPRKQCWEDVDLIGRQLTLWKVVDVPSPIGPNGEIR